jgi:hypothetical protein
MADLPRYQSSGLMPADIQRLDLANVKEGLNLTKTITSSLDRMSDFAFKEAANKAVREGEQYGAENQPTVDQVLLAKEQGQDINSLFPKPGTYFGDAARKIQGAQLRLELEAKGREELRNISSALDVGQIDLKEAQLRIKGMTDGYGRTLAQLSPEDGLRFRASINVAANDTYNKANEKQNKIYQAGLRSNAERLIADTPTLLSDSLRYEANPTLLNEKFNIQYQRAFDVASATMDPAFVDDQMKAFESKRLNAIIDYVISPDFAANPVEGFRKITNKDYGKLSEVMKTVDIDKLKKQYIERSGDIEKSFTNASKVNASINVDKVANIKDDIYSGKISGSVGYKRIQALGITLPESERQSMLNGDLAGATPQLFGRYESMVENGRLGEEDLDNMGVRGEMSWKQVNDLKKKARNNDPAMSAAISFVNADLGVPDPMTQGFNRERKMAAEVKAHLYNAREVARSQGLPFNAMETAREYIKGVRQGSEFVQHESEVDTFKTRLKNSGITYDPLRIYTDEDLKAAGVGKYERGQILKQQDKVRKEPQ